MPNKDIKIAPISSSFFLTSIVGFYISFIWLIPKAQDTEFIARFGPEVAQSFTDFGVSFAFVFGIMFIASMISLTYAPAKSLLNLERYERTHKGGTEISFIELLKRDKKPKK